MAGCYEIEIVQGVYLRPVDKFLIPLSAMFFLPIFYFLLSSPFSLLEKAIPLGVFGMAGMWSLYLRFITDARLRRGVSAEILGTDLIVRRGGRTLCTSPLGNDHWFEPGWRDRHGVGSIPLPGQGAVDRYFSNFDIWLPSRSPCQRLEFVRNVSDVVAKLNHRPPTEAGTPASL
jgi:hypothetical protein